MICEQNELITKSYVNFSMNVGHSEGLASEQSFFSFCHYAISLSILQIILFPALNVIKDLFKKII